MHVWAALVLSEGWEGSVPRLLASGGLLAFLGLYRRPPAPRTPICLQDHMALFPYARVSVQNRQIPLLCKDAVLLDRGSPYSTVTSS